MALDTQQQALELANQHRQSGRLKEAEAAYRKILLADPNQPDALHLLGLVVYQLGERKKAVELLQRAVAADPSRTDYRFNLSVMLEEAGQIDEAIANYQTVVQQRTDFVQAHQNLASLLQKTSQFDPAIAAYRKLISLKPQPDFYFNLGNVFFAKDDWNQAIVAYRQALALSPNYPAATNNLGNALRLVGRPEEAITVLRQGTSPANDDPDIAYNLGLALQAVNRSDEAMAIYRNILASHPDHESAANALGVMLQTAGRLDEAMAVFRQFLSLRPQAALVRNNLGEVLRSSGKLDEAIAEFRQAADSDPALAEAAYNLGIALRAKNLLDESIEAYREAIARNPKMGIAHNNLGNAQKDIGLLADAIESYGRAVALQPELIDADCNRILTMHYSQDYDLPAILPELGDWNRRNAIPLRKFITPHRNAPDPDRRLRIGYVSADYREHACAFFLDPLLANHDHAKFEIFLYAQLEKPDSLTPRFQKYADHWRQTYGLSDEKMAAQIRADQIDLLIDAKLHTSENRLLVFARKPAPIQISWLGYPGSSGLETIDYRLMDQWIEPSNHEYPLPEQPIFIPDCFWAYDPLTSEPSVNELPALSGGFLTFGCVNNFCKVSDGTLDLWIKSMKAVKNSHLLLMAPPGSARRRVLKRFTENGIREDRVEFLDRQSRPLYLRLYHRIDVCLDTLPYNGHTTSLDSLWMGVPVVTRIGNTPPGRVGWTHLNNLNLQEFGAHSDEEFVQILTKWSGELPRLSSLRASLREKIKNSPLMDGPGYTRKVEAAYRKVWRKWCQAPR